MRYILVGTWLMAGLSAIGQDQWSFVEPAVDRLIQFTDAQEIGPGYLLTCFQYSWDLAPNSKASVLRLNVDGTLFGRSALWNDSFSVEACAILHDPDGERYHVFGDIQNPGQQWGYYHMGMTADLARSDSVMYRYSDMDLTSMDNACGTANGDMIITGGGRTPGNPLFEVLNLVRISSSGDSLTSARIQNPNLIVPRDVIELTGDTIMVACLGTPALPEYLNGFASYLKFAPDLTLLNGFIGVPFDGSLVLPDRVNSVNDHLNIRQLQSGNFAVSGRAGDLTNGTRGIVQKLSPSGAWQGAFTPRSEFPYDNPAIYGAMDSTANGEILFANMANFEPGPPSPFLPTEPNRVHVYRLDTALNLICTNVIDGFPENAYYWVNRIKITSDGGYLLVGSRVDLDQPTIRFDGWARKFSADECFVGVDEYANGPVAHVFPNPGTISFSAELNGTVIGAPQLFLYNTGGRMVRTQPLRFGRATVDANDLSAGVYFYRIIDEHTRLVASGKWMKE